jgi:hypothetical protein
VTHVFHRQLRTPPPVAVDGHGHSVLIGRRQSFDAQHAGRNAAIAAL